MTKTIGLLTLCVTGHLQQCTFKFSCLDSEFVIFITHFYNLNSRLVTTTLIRTKGNVNKRGIILHNSHSNS